MCLSKRGTSSQVADGQGRACCAAAPEEERARRCLAEGLPSLGRGGASSETERGEGARALVRGLLRRQLEAEVVPACACSVRVSLSKRRRDFILWDGMRKGFERRRRFKPCAERATRPPAGESRFARRRSARMGGARGGGRRQGGLRGPALREAAREDEFARRALATGKRFPRCRLWNFDAKYRASNSRDLSFLVPSRLCHSVFRVLAGARASIRDPDSLVLQRPRLISQNPSCGIGSQTGRASRVSLSLSRPLRALSRPHSRV